MTHDRWGTTSSRPRRAIPSVATGMIAKIESPLDSPGAADRQEGTEAQETSRKHAPPA